jgi:hypothetical protein
VGLLALKDTKVKAPSVINRNSASATKDNVVSYWVSPSGEIQYAPDSRITEEQMRAMPEYRHWRRFEAVGAKEIEKISLIVSRQMFDKRRKLKVQQALRELEFLKQARVSAHLRVAQGYSKNDALLSAKQEKTWAAREERAMAVIVSDLTNANTFDPASRTTALEIEVRERSTSKLAHINQKREGVL